MKNVNEANLRELTRQFQPLVMTEINPIAI